MLGRIIRSIHGPEWYIREDLEVFLTARQWMVEKTHGNLYQQGFPDLYIAHRKYGERWIDVKQPGGKYTFTNAQKQKWPVWESYRIGIWILTAATQEEYDKLFQPPNWRAYWKKKWGEIPDIDSLLDQVEES